MSRLPIKAGFLIRAALSPGYSSSVSADLSALTDYRTSPSQRRAHANTHQAFVCFSLFITVFPPRHGLNKHGMLMHSLFQSPEGPLFPLPSTLARSFWFISHQLKTGETS